MRRFTFGLSTTPKAVSALIAAAAFLGGAAPAATGAAGTDQSMVIVKLRAGTTLAGAGHLDTVLAPGRRVRRLISRGAVPRGRGTLGDYYVIKLAAGQRADDVARRLTRLDAVATAYARPLPAPPPSTPSYVPYQLSLRPAPNGLGVNATIGGSATTTPYPGTDGSKVKVADLEYSWNVNHEDVSKLRASGARWSIGTPADFFNDTNHGTAVAGIIAADRNGSGIDGIVAGTEFHMVNTDSVDGGLNIANAVTVAAGKLSKGDVILIEQQAWAPGGHGYAPVEINQAEYDAIRSAVAKGITVIEPAGNGDIETAQGYDLDAPSFGGAFTTARPNSGAIVVGAGGAGCGSTPSRARMAFSNYGSRVDVQGLGECVFTSGYGDAGSRAQANAFYTSSFSGTSSASALIAGVAAEVSSSYEQTNKVAMAPAALKAALRTGGSAQDTSLNPGAIGVRPNLAAALRLTDITPPSAPTLAAKATAQKQNTLTWTTATDNLGYVQYYLIYRNDAWVGIVSGASRSYTDTAVAGNVRYAYRVVADDASGNLSASSNTVSLLSR